MKLLIPVFLAAIAAAQSAAPRPSAPPPPKYVANPTPIAPAPVQPAATATPIPTPHAEICPLPANWAGVGAAYNSYAAPNIAGWASEASLISCSGQVYSFSSWDITSARTKPFTAQTSARTGIALVVRQFGPVYILGLGDAGVAAAASNLSGAFSGGGMGFVRLGKTNWTINVGARLLHTGIAGNETIYEFGLGRIGLFGSK